jgi:hypothetical protein
VAPEYFGTKRCLSLKNENIMIHRKALSSVLNCYCAFVYIVAKTHYRSWKLFLLPSTNKPSKFGEKEEETENIIFVFFFKI